MWPGVLFTPSIDRKVFGFWFSLHSLLTERFLVICQIMHLLRLHLLFSYYRLTFKKF